MSPNPTVRNAGKPGRPKGIPKTGGGSRKGIPNKATVEFRQAVTTLLNATQDNMIRWLTEVAEGTGEEGGKPNPAKALELMASLAEFAAPKLARTEHVGDKDAPLRMEFGWKSDKS
jgi:hypothetical protein